MKPHEAEKLFHGAFLELLPSLQSQPDKRRKDQEKGLGCDQKCDHNLRI